MTVFSHARRVDVVDRAGHRCEYCHLPTRGQVATFPIDHVIPRSAGGSNDSTNLALTCPYCNAHKWTDIEARDPESGLLARYFHPRQDVWENHFRWSPNGSGELIGLSATGRATIAGLRMNAADMVALRQLLAEVKLFQEIVS
jgi:hypothetical protein